MTRHSIAFPILATILLSGCGWLGGDNVDENATGQAAEKAVVAATDGDLVTPVTEQIGTPMVTINGNAFSPAGCSASHRP